MTKEDAYAMRVYEEMALRNQWIELVPEGCDRNTKYVKAICP